MKPLGHRNQRITSLAPVDWWSAGASVGSGGQADEPATPMVMLMVLLIPSVDAGQAVASSAASVSDCGSNRLLTSRETTKVTTSAVAKPT